MWQCLGEYIQPGNKLLWHIKRISQRKAYLCVRRHGVRIMKPRKSPEGVRHWLSKPKSATGVWTGFPSSKAHTWYRWGVSRESVERVSSERCLSLGEYRHYSSQNTLISNSQKWRIESPVRWSACILTRSCKHEKEGRHIQRVPTAVLMKHNRGDKRRMVLLLFREGQVLNPLKGRHWWKIK